jgi:hypothetical protein
MWPFKKPFEKAPVIDEAQGTINGYAVTREDHTYAVHVANLPKERVYHATMSTIENWRLCQQDDEGNLFQGIGTAVQCTVASTPFTYEWTAIGPEALARPLARPGNPTDE